ncbi:MAG TPA: RNA methyltransferase [Acidobacteriaceae bacterium]|nr:RNA methyltransferase [Acidobacteriaceae bacterium]
MKSSEYGLRTIESRQNSRVKELRAGLQRGIKTEQGLIAIEGDHLLREAVRSGLRVRTIFLRSGDEHLLDPDLAGKAEVVLVPGKIFASAVVTAHPQGIAALIEPPAFGQSRPSAEISGEESPFSKSGRWKAMLRGMPLIVLAGGLQDPGNLGTLVRSAEAFGATGMILLPGTVSLWNPKALRASSGSAFRLPSAAITAEEAFAALRANGVQLIAAVSRGGSAQADLTRPAALLLGNEGAGLPDAWVGQADARVTIPCPGAVESLNAAVAGSVLLYEAARQRALKDQPAAPAVLKTHSAKQGRR